MITVITALRLGCGLFLLGGNMEKFLKSNETNMRLARTIAQGIISVIIVNIDLLISGINVIPSEYKPIAVAVMMAILSPIMSTLSGSESDAEVESDDEQ